MVGRCRVGSLTQQEVGERESIGGETDCESGLASESRLPAKRRKGESKSRLQGVGEREPAGGERERW